MFQINIMTLINEQVNRQYSEIGYINENERDYTNAR